MWKNILKSDRQYIPYKNTLIIFTRHFFEKLNDKFTDIKFKRIKDVIKEKINQNQIPMNEAVMIKLRRQGRPAFLVVIKEKRKGRGLKTAVKIKTIREMHINTEKNYTGMILNEN